MPTNKKRKPRRAGTVRQRPEDFHYITPQEHKAISSAFPALRNGRRNKAIYLLWYYCGLRISESISLRIEQVYDGYNILPRLILEQDQCKGKRHGRTIPLRDPGFILRGALDSYLKLRKQQTPNDHAQPLFLSERGTAVDRTTIFREFKSTLKKAGVDTNIRPHDARHSAITNVQKKGRNIILTRDFAGHTSTETTNRYCHSNLDDLETVMAVAS